MINKEHKSLSHAELDSASQFLYSLSAEIPHQVRNDSSLY